MARKSAHRCKLYPEQHRYGSNRLAQPLPGWLERTGNGAPRQMTVKYRTRLTVLLVFDMRGTAENAVPLFLSANRLGCRISGPRSSASIFRPSVRAIRHCRFVIQNPDCIPLHRFSKAQPTKRKIRQKSSTLLPVSAQFPLSLLPIVNKRVLLFTQWQKRKEQKSLLFSFFHCVLISFCRAVPVARSQVKAPH